MTRFVGMFLMAALVVSAAGRDDVGPQGDVPQSEQTSWQPAGTFAPASPDAGFSYVYVSAGSSNNYWPWSTLLGSSARFQMLYLQSEIGRAGRISAFAFQNGNAARRGFQNLTVKFCHTTVASLSTDFAANYGGATPETVHFAPSQVVGSGSVGGWDTVPVSWQYDNQHNLLVEITWDGADPGPSVSCRYGVRTPTRRTWAWDWQAASGVMVDEYLYNARFTFDENDVACSYIAAPVAQLDSGFVIAPACSVFNYGSSAASYPVHMRIGAMYRESTAVSEHLPGTSRYVTFPAWTAGPRGYVQVACSTALANDPNPANDRARDSVFVRVWDAGAQSIADPHGTYQSGATVVPAATWRNNGNTPATFQAWMCLDNPARVRVYSQKIDVNNLLPNMTMFLNTFPGHRLVDAGSWTVKCSTWQYGDMRLSNNVIVDTFRVQSRVAGDIGVVAIIEPGAAVDTAETIAPSGRWRNYGPEPQGFTAWMMLRNPAGTRVYFEDTTVLSLAAGAEVALTFPCYFPGRDTGRWLCRCSTYAANDSNITNDWRDLPFVVSGRPPWPVGWQEVEGMTAGAKLLKEGGWLALEQDGGLIFAAKGNKTSEFYSFDPMGDNNGVWTTLPAWPNGTEAKPPAKGACATGDGAGRVYAVKGNNTMGFWRYSHDSLSWMQLADVPYGESRKRVKGGGDMVYVVDADTGFVYFMKGYKTDFFRFNTVSGFWDTTLPQMPTGSNAKWDKGSWLSFDGAGRIWAHKAKYHELWAYDIPNRSWVGPYEGMPLAGMTGKSKKSKDGGSAVCDGGMLYALKGGNTIEFWMYNTADNTWVEHDTIPAVGSTGKKKRVKGGGDVVRWSSGIFFAIKGNKCNEMWRYVVPSQGADMCDRGGILAGPAGLPDRFFATTTPVAIRHSLVRWSHGGSGPSTVSVYDIAGRPVLRQMATGRTGSLDLRGLSAGVYLVRFESASRRETCKLVIE